MVRFNGEEKEPLLDAYTDDIESSKTDSNALEQLRVAQEAALRQRRRRRRLFHFITLAFLTLAFIGVRHCKNWGKVDFASSFPEDEPHKLPVVPGVTLEHCTEWKGDQEGIAGAPTFRNEGGYYIPPRPKRSMPKRKSAMKGSVNIQAVQRADTSVTSYAEFKLDSGKPLFFVSRGGFSYGDLSVVQSEDDSSDIKTTVAVTTSGHDSSGHWHQHFLDVVRVCTIKKDGDEEATGVGIFTPEWHNRGPGRRWRHHDNVKFHVVVEIPKSKDPLTLKALQTDMPAFSQTLATEKGAVSFKDLHMSGAFAYISALDAVAENLTVTNAHAAIEGNFKTSKAILLETSNAQINVWLELENTNSTSPVTADLFTSNGQITSRNTLTNPDWATNNTGNFRVFAGTSNARIQMTFPSAPINSTLDLTADTSLGGIDVALHPTYEGEFFLTTSLAKADLLLTQGEVDPEGKGRHRSALTHPMRSEVYGETWWGDNYPGKQAHWGSVKVKTALAPATLRFNSTKD